MRLSFGSSFIASYFQNFDFLVFERVGSLLLKHSDLSGLLTKTGQLYVQPVKGHTKF